jgi:uncharacterized membrane protein
MSPEEGKVEGMASGSISEKQFDQILKSGNERPVILAARAQRIVWATAVVTFLTWLFWGRKQAEWMNNLVFALAILFIVGAAVLRITVRRLDRRAMSEDMALIERSKKETRPAPPPRKPGS